MKFLKLSPILLTAALALPAPAPAAEAQPALTVAPRAVAAGMPTVVPVRR